MPPKNRLNKDGSDPYGTEPMDLDLPAQASRGSEGSRRQYIKPADYGKCPRCTTPKVALIKHNGHLTWKVHTIATYGRARFECEASGQRVCDLPEGEPSLHYGKPLSCICEGS